MYNYDMLHSYKIICLQSSKIILMTACFLWLFIFETHLQALGYDESESAVKSIRHMNEWFAGRNGWIGGDGVYSIPLQDGRILWVFGDTFVGEVRKGKRFNAKLVHNSLAIQQTPKSKPCPIICKTKSNQPLSFFEPPDKRGYFWPFHGISIGNSLWLFLLQVETTDADSVFGFRIIGTWLAHAADVSREISRNSFSLRKIPFGIYENGKPSGRTLFFGSWLLRINDEIFIYGVNENAAGRDMIVARAPAERICDFEAWRFLCAEGWTKNFNKCISLLNDAMTEFSVTTSPFAQNASSTSYIQIQSGGYLSPYIVARVAATHLGPWSAPKIIFVCPEPEKKTGVFTYAAKAHPELSNAGGLVVSYVANSMRFEDLFEAAWLYRPTFISVPYGVLGVAK